MVDIAKLRRAIELDLQAKFPSPTLQQQQVISAVRGMFAAAERMDSSRHRSDDDLEFRCDGNSLPQRRSTRSVDDCLEQIRRMRSQ